MVRQEDEKRSSIRFHSSRRRQSWAKFSPSCRAHWLTHVVPHSLRPCAVTQHMAGMHGTKASKILLYWSNRPGPSLCEWWLTFVGKLACGCVHASAIDVPMLLSTGVKRM